MSKPVVFVIGASGDVGAATVASLSNKYADLVEIKAGVRNLDSDKANKLKLLSNVTVVQATMGDGSLVSTLSGVTTLYIVTPNGKERAQLAISTAESAKQAGVKHIAVVSISLADYPDILFGQQFNELETKISELGVNYTIIRLPAFLESCFSFKPTIVSQGAVFHPADPSICFAHSTAEDMGKASAAILVNPEKYNGQKLAFVSSIHSFNDFVKELSDALGKEVKYIQTSYEDAKKSMLEHGLAEWQVDAFLEIVRVVDSALPLVTQGDLELFKRLTGEDPTSLKQWIAKYSREFK